MQSKELQPGDLFRYKHMDIGLMWVPVPGQSTPATAKASDCKWAYDDEVSLEGSTLPIEPSKELPAPDMVNAPAHYTRLKPEPMQVIEAWELDFQLGSALKYLARAGHKGGPADEILDLKKSVSFINRRIQRLEQKLKK